MYSTRFAARGAWVATLAMVAALVIPSVSYAATTEQINARVQQALDRFQNDVPGATDFLNRAQGVLVFPHVVQAGFGIGGEFGEGQMLIHGQPAGYYSIGAASVGFQFGAQEKDVIIVFLRRSALVAFQAKNGFTVGVDGGVTLINLGAHASLNTTTTDQPVIGFIVGDRGLMYNLTLQGTKISRIHPAM